MPAEECRSCRREIDWATKWPEEIQDKGPNKGMLKTVPVDHDSVDKPEGKLEVWSEPVIPVSGGDPVTVLRVRYLKVGEAVIPGRHRGVNHFATCPERDKWRRK